MSKCSSRRGRSIDNDCRVDHCVCSAEIVKIGAKMTYKRYEAKSSDSLQAKSFWVYLNKRGITSEDSSCNQNSQISKANRARRQKRIIEADFDMVTFWSFDSIGRKRNKNVGCDSASVPALDALSNDTNLAENGWLGAEILLIYWKNVEHENSRK